MSRTEAYQIVFNDLSKCNMFRGIYDARNGNKHFLFGIQTVMEWIAAGVSDKVYNDFSDMFTKNMTKCEEEARTNDRTYDC